MSKNATIRLPEEIQNKLKENFGGIQSAISLIVEPFDRLRVMSIAELKDLFTKQELIALIDNQNGVMLTPDFVYNKSFLLAQLEDFEKFENGISRNGAEYAQLANKIDKISNAQVYYLLLDIHIFWETSLDLEQYLIKFFS